MRRSEAYLPTSREGIDHDQSAVRLAHRAGLVEQFGSGLYGFAPAGERVRRKVVRRVERAMETVGGQRVNLPQLQYRPVWERSGRWGSFEGEMFTFENREGQEMCLAPSHEEGIVHLVDGHVRSYEDLPPATPAVIVIVEVVGTSARTRTSPCCSTRSERNTATTTPGTGCSGRRSSR